jgi:hypothetical protein
MPGGASVAAGPDAILIGTVTRRLDLRASDGFELGSPTAHPLVPLVREEPLAALRKRRIATEVAGLSLRSSSSQTASTVTSFGSLAGGLANMRAPSPARLMSGPLI